MSKKYKYRRSSFPRDVLGSSDNFDYERDQDFRSTLPEITCGESNSVSGIPVKRTASHGILLIYSTRNFRTFLIKSFAFGKYYNFGIFRKLFRKNSCTICLRFESFEIFGGMGGVQHCNMCSTVSLMVETLKIWQRSTSQNENIFSPKTPLV